MGTIEIQTEEQDTQHCVRTLKFLAKIPETKIIASTLKAAIYNKNMSSKFVQQKEITVDILKAQTTDRQIENDRNTPIIRHINMHNITFGLTQDIWKKQRNLQKA